MSHKIYYTVIYPHKTIDVHYGSQVLNLKPKSYFVPKYVIKMNSIYPYILIIQFLFIGINKNCIIRIIISKISSIGNIMILNCRYYKSVDMLVFEVVKLEITMEK